MQVGQIGQTVILTCPTEQLPIFFLNHNPQTTSF